MSKKYFTDAEMQRLQSADKNTLRQNWAKMSKESQNAFRETYTNTINRQKNTATSSNNLVGFQGYDSNQIGIPGVNMVEKKNTNNYTGLQGYDESQVGIPGVNVVSNSNNALASNNTSFRSSNSIQNFQNDMNRKFDRLGENAVPYKNEFNKKVKIAIKQENDTIDAYSLKRGELYKNKGYYKNFDSVDNIFNSVLTDIRETQKNTGTITDLDYQKIASKYGVSVDEVKDPGSIFNKLEYTEDGERVFGITKAKQNMEKMTRDYERNLKNLDFQLEGATQNINNQIEDVELQLRRNLAWGEASGVWNNMMRSSGYRMGLDNLRQDTERTISRLRDAKDRLKYANDENIRELTEDYNLALLEAKKTLDYQMKELKFDSGLALNNAIKKYDIDSGDLTDVLQSIRDNLGANTMQIFESYHKTMALINKNANDRLNYFEDLEKYNEERTNKRYNEYIKNNGQLLGNTSLNQLIREVQSGVIPIDKLKDFKSIMLNSIQATLGKFGDLTQNDLKEMEEFLDDGYTPAQIISIFKESGRFSGVSEGVYKKFNDNTLYNSKTGELKSVGKNNTIPVGDNYKNENVNGTITQTYGTKSPLGIDNVKLANGEVGTPGIDIAGSYGSNIKSFTTGEVIGVVTGKKRGDKGYGNSVRIRDEEGNIHMYNHLADINVKVGDKVSKNTKIGTMGNSGSTLGKTGTHLDYRVSSNGEVGLNEGNWIDPSQFMGGNKDFSVSDIRAFNGLTPSERMKQKNNPEYIEFEKKRYEIFSDVNASIDEIMKYSRGGEKLTSGEREQLGKYNTVLSQIGDLQQKISKINTGPIIGNLKKLNPYDTDAKVISAQLRALVPNLARGIYGEVGVLTNEDIKNYSQTIPNLTNTNDINNAILAMNIKLFANGYKSLISTYAASGLDVSGHKGIYESLLNKVEELEASLPKGQATNKEFDSLYE